VPVCYVGQFAVIGANIRSHDRRTWAHLLKALSRGGNIEEEHFAERIWAPMLADVKGQWSHKVLPRMEAYFLYPGAPLTGMLAIFPK
jgi:hypothetical protein